MYYIEQNCTTEHEGRVFEAGGAYIAGDRVVGYLKLPDGNHPSALGTVTDWHGKPMGTCVVTSRWRLPRGLLSTHMLQVEAVINGRAYTGRGGGDGMIWYGKVKKP